MSNFRRVIMALAVLALFTGLASAQVIGAGSQLTCATNVTATPQLRGEGFTEQTGDITIVCTGGVVPVVGAVVPLVNFTIFYNSLVTSRLFASPNTSEALLLIDEPGSGLAGDGPARTQKLCTTPLSGCPATVGSVGAGILAVGPDNTYAPNVYEGIVNGNSVTFNGVPVLPPTTTGSRVYRITNVRINAQPLNGGNSSGGTPVQAFVSTSNPGLLSISNSTPNVGFVSASLTATAAASTTITQCVSRKSTDPAISTVTFKENFASAFKTRLNPTADTQYNAQNGFGPGVAPNATTQSTPGAPINSESNFVFPLPGGVYAGLAGYGTRLKASFNNIPTGAKLFVSTANVTPAPAIVGGTSTLSYAQLVIGESVTDGGSGGIPPLADATAVTTEVTLNNGTGSAVWEVLNTNPNLAESFSFGVFLTYTSNVAQNQPLPGGSTVNLSYAPTATSAAALDSNAYPRFAGDSTKARDIFTIGICQTVLLYPFVTNQAGFDTGISVANTTIDPSGSAGAQNGKCVLNWFGGTTATPTVPPASFDTGVINAGAVYANTVQTMAPSFQGYMIAVCNFQYAHGFAAVSSNYGAVNGIFTTYLAVVLDNPRSNTRTSTAENGGN